MNTLLFYLRQPEFINETQTHEHALINAYSIGYSYFLIIVKQSLLNLSYIDIYEYIRNYELLNIPCYVFNVKGTVFSAGHVSYLVLILLVFVEVFVVVSTSTAAVAVLYVIMILILFCPKCFN